MKATYDNTTEDKAERRVRLDRRQWNCHHDFPYVDSHGYLVVCNRRTNQDRRQSRKKIKAAR